MTDPHVYRLVQAATYVGTYDGGPGILLACGCRQRVETWEMAQSLTGVQMPCWNCELEIAEQTGDYTPRGRRGADLG